MVSPKGDHVLALGRGLPVAAGSLGVAPGVDLGVGPAYLLTWGVAPNSRIRAFQAVAVGVGRLP